MCLAPSSLRKRILKLDVQRNRILPATCTYTHFCSHSSPRATRDLDCRGTMRPTRLTAAVTMVCDSSSGTLGEVRHASPRAHQPTARPRACAPACALVLVPLPLRATTATSHRAARLLRAPGTLAQRCGATSSDVIAFYRHRTHEHHAESVLLYCPGRTWAAVARLLRLQEHAP